MSDFHIVVLGCTGGPFENNLSSYLLSTDDFIDFIALDAGSLLGGIEAALAKGVFADFPFIDSNSQKAKELLAKHIKSYLISHAHLDHIAGMVINSQLDEKKSIYGLDETIDHLRDHIFNDKIWPNYGSEGLSPLHIYDYHRMAPEQITAVKGTPFSVMPFKLNHPEPHLSTAFLIEAKGAYVLYFGDTTSDIRSDTKRLMSIWQKVAPLIDEGKLKAILLECSYAHANEKKAFFGHLDTHMMIQELRELSKLCKTLSHVKIVVTHRKQMLLQSEEEPDLIEKELTALNDLGIEFIFPTQGQRITI